MGESVNITTHSGATLDYHVSRLSHQQSWWCRECSTFIVLWDDEEELRSHICEEDE